MKVDTKKVNIMLGEAHRKIGRPSCFMIFLKNILPKKLRQSIELDGRLKALQDVVSICWY